MKFNAIVRDMENNNTIYLTNKEYEDKQTFKKDILFNGYKVISIFNKFDTLVREYGYTNLVEYFKNGEGYLNIVIKDMAIKEIEETLKNYNHYSSKDIKYYTRIIDHIENY